MARFSWGLLFSGGRQRVNPELKANKTVTVSKSYATATVRQHSPNRPEHHSRERTASSLKEGFEETDRPPSVITLPDRGHDPDKVEALIIHIIKKNEDEVLDQVRKQLETYGRDVGVTSTLMKAACDNWRYYPGGNPLAHLLLSHVLNAQHEVSLDPRALQIALEYAHFSNETDFEPVVKLGYWGGPYFTSPLRRRIHKIISESPIALKILEMMLRLRPATFSLALPSTTSGSSSPAAISSRTPQDLVLAAVENRKCAADLLTLLLRHDGDQLPITHEVLIAAAGNHTADKEIFEILSRERPESLRPITPRLLCAAMSTYRDDERTNAIVNVLLAADPPENNQAWVITEAVVKLFQPMTIHGRLWGDIPDNTGRLACLRTIMEQRPAAVHFTGLALDVMASLEDVVLLEEFFSQKAVSSRSRIPAHMVEAAAANRRAGTQVMEALLRHRGGEITITERVLVAAAENDGCGLEILEMILRDREDEIRVTSRILEAVVNVELTTDRSLGRYRSGYWEGVDPSYRERDKLKLKLLLGHARSRGERIGLTSTILDHFPWEDDWLRETLLSFFDRHSILVTSRVLEKDMEDVLDQLLKDVGGIHFSKSALREMESSISPEIWAVLFRRAGHKVDSQIREAALITAIANEDHRTEIMELVLAQPWEEITITERVISTGWATASRRGHLQTLLQNLITPVRSVPASFSSDAVQTMLENCHPGIVRLWLQTERGRKDRITPDMIEFLAKNAEFGGDILMILLRTDRRIVITSSVITAAINSSYSPHNLRCLHILLSERPDIPISTLMLKSAAATCEEPTLWHWMLWESGRVADSHLTEEVIIVAMGNPYFADTVMADLLLRNESSGFLRVTERILEAIAWNKELGPDIFKMLLKERGEDLCVTERVLEAAVCNVDALRIVLDLAARGEEETGSAVQVSESVLETVIARNTSDTVVPVLELLLERRGDEIMVTERVLETVMSKSGRDAVIPVLELLFQHRGDEITISERILEAAASHDSAVPILELFLEERPDEVVITQRVLEAAVSNDDHAPKVIELLIDEFGEDGIETSEAVLVAACRNRWRGKRTLEIIFDRLGQRQYVITEKILDTALRNDATIVGLFLDRPGTCQIHMTTAVFEAALESGNGHERELHQLLDQERPVGGSRICLTELGLQKCLSQWDPNTLTPTGQDFLLWFVRSYPQNIQITEGLVALMARLCLPLLLELYEERGDEIDISQRVLEEAAAGGGGYGSLDFLDRPYSRSGGRRIQKDHLHEDYGNWVARMLELGRSRGTCRVNNRVVEAAAGNPKNGHHIVRLFVEEHGTEFTVNERILKAAAKNQGASEGLGVLRVLFRERGEEAKIYITESVVEVAASNVYCGKEMVDLLLSSGDRRAIWLTDGIADAAARNEKCGEGILDLLRVCGGRKV